MRLFWPLMVVYIVAVVGGSYALSQYEPEPTWLAVIISLVASIPLVFVLIAMLRYFSEADEFTRLLQLKAFAWGAVAIVSAIFVVGFLQMFGAIESVEVFWFGPGFFVAYGLSYYLVGGKECLP